jgi:hypothetical protein
MDISRGDISMIHLQKHHESVWKALSNNEQSTLLLHLQSRHGSIPRKGYIQNFQELECI